jgi:hypothetical protein
MYNIGWSHGYFAEAFESCTILVGLMVIFLRLLGHSGKSVRLTNHSHMTNMF